MKNILKDGQDYLGLWVEQYEKEYSNYQHNISFPNLISLENCKGSVLTTDTYN